eukprot:5878902-Pyramimonas_sp.AAC.1
MPSYRPRAYYTSPPLLLLPSAARDGSRGSTLLRLLGALLELLGQKAFFSFPSALPTLCRQVSGVRSRERRVAGPLTSARLRQRRRPREASSAEAECYSGASRDGGIASHRCFRRYTQAEHVER